MTKPKHARRRTRKIIRLHRAIPRKNIGRGARLCRDADNCDYPQTRKTVSRADQSRTQLAAVENSISQIDKVIKRLKYNIGQQDNVARESVPASANRMSVTHNHKRAKVARARMKTLKQQLRQTERIKSNIESKANIIRRNITNNSATRNAQALSRVSSIDSQEAMDMLADLDDSDSDVSGIRFDYGAGRGALRGRVRRTRGKRRTRK